MRVLPALLLLAACTAHAEIYVCDDNGKKSYSQQPCGKDAKAVTLENGPRQITIPEQPDESYAADFCNLALGAWDMASTSKRIHNYRYNGASEEQIQGYLRERIANFEELSRRNPDAGIMIERVAQTLHSLAMQYPAPTPQTTRVFKDSCLGEARRRLGTDTPAAKTPSQKSHKLTM